VPRVQSINSSGHKYGLVYPGVGWILWRDQEALPSELVFEVDYLGGETPTMAINFSRPGAQVVAQYYTFLRLGRAGYTELQGACRSTARYLADEIAALGPFELISDGSELPVLAFRLAERANYTVYDVSDQLRQHGWLVPAYAFPPDLEDVHVLRIVVRNGFGRDLARLLLDDLRRSLERLERLDRPLPLHDREAGFHH